MPKILTIGETMAVMVPSETGPYQYINHFRLCFAGAESNTAIGLSKLGHQTEWLSCVGDDEFGRFLLSRIRAEGVSVSHVRLDAHAPTGLMAKRFNPSSETEIFYYRSGSAASQMNETLISEKSFEDVGIVHMTGITPVLSQSCLRLTRRVFELARSLNVRISFDPNIRMKLWKQEDYRDLIKEFISQSNIVFMGLDEGQLLYGERTPQTLRDIIFTSGCTDYLALKNGSAGAYVYSINEDCYIPPHPCICIDPVGAGDAFNAGFLSGILDGRPLKDCGQRGGITGALCTQVQGDIEGLPTKKELIDIQNHISPITR